METKKMSVAELKAQLAEAEAQEREEKLAKKEAYETDRNNMVVALISEAVEVHSALAEFKQRSMKTLKAWFERMKEYGDAKETQENFQVLSKDGSLKIIFTYNVTKGFDERSKLAEEKLKEYLETKVRLRDLKSYKWIKSLLERNTVSGDLDISNIQKLYQQEMVENDPLYTESMNLFRESYVEQGSKYYARFQKKDANEQMVTIKLDFANI